MSLPCRRQYDQRAAASDGGRSSPSEPQPRSLAYASFLPSEIAKTHIYFICMLPKGSKHEYGSTNDGKHRISVLVFMEHCGVSCVCVLCCSWWCMCVCCVRCVKMRWTCFGFVFQFIISVAFVVCVMLCVSCICCVCCTCCM